MRCLGLEVVRIMKDAFGRSEVVLHFSDLSDEPSEGLDDADDVAESEALRSLQGVESGRWRCRWRERRRKREAG